MKFIIIVAGVPLDIYAKIYDAREQILGPNTTFVGLPLKCSQYSQCFYTDDYTAKLARMVASIFERDHHSQLRDTGLGLVYFDHHSGTETNIVERFFPAALLVAVDAQYDSFRVG